MKAKMTLMAAAGLIASWPGAAWSQESTAPGSGALPPSAPQREAPDRDTTVQDIVVTAQRREQSLQRVPLTVSVISDKKLAATGVNTIAELDRLVSGVQIPYVAPTSTPYIRGVGANGSNPNDEPSVATYVDGVYMAAPFANVFSFGKVERVEVLKGPQGTLFGRNATGGLFQIITPKPSHTASAEAYAGYGNYDTISAGAYATMGLTDTIAVSANITFADQRDGYGRNITLNTDTMKYKEWSARGKLLFEPSSSTSITISADYALHKDSFPDFQLPEGVLGADGQTHNFGRYITNGGGTPAIRLTQRGASLHIDQDLGIAKIVSITARRIFDEQYNVDTDATPTNYARGELSGKIKSFTQELQLLSNEQSNFSWIVGGFFFDTDAGYDPGRLSGLRRSAPLPFVDIFARQSTRSWSVYGQATLEILAGLKLTGGLRYTDERQRLNARRIGGGVTTTFPEREQNFDGLTWRAALSYDFSSDVMGYASFNKGVKSGGFVLLNPAAAPYRPEYLDAYEIGLKSRLFDRKLQFNVNGFYYRYKDIQVSQLLATGTTSTNAARAEIKGVEMEVELRPVPAWTISANGAYLDGKYLDFANPNAFPPSPLSPLLLIANASGYDTVRTPRFNASFSSTYTIPSALGSFAVTGTAKYNGKYYFDPVNIAVQPSYWLIDGSISWTAPSEAYGLRLWVKNALDQRYLSESLPSGLGQLQIEAAPRTYGLTANVKF